MPDKSSNIIEFPFDVDNMLRLLQADKSNHPAPADKNELPEIAVRITVTEVSGKPEFVLHRMEKKPGRNRFILPDRRAETLVNIHNPDELWQAMLDIFKQGSNWKLIWDHLDEIT